MSSKIDFLEPLLFPYFDKPKLMLISLYVLLLKNLSVVLVKGYGFPKAWDEYGSMFFLLFFMSYLLMRSDNKSSN